MSQTEAPSSVLSEFNPELANVGSISTTSTDHKIRETPSHRRRNGVPIKSIFVEVLERQNNKLTTVDIFANGEYTTIIIEEPDSDRPKQFHVNGTHIKISDGENSAKFDLIGNRVMEEMPSMQLNLIEGMNLTDGESFQIPLNINNPNALPESFSPHTGEFLKSVSDSIRSSKKHLPTKDSVRLSTVFGEILGNIPAVPLEK